MEPAGPDLELDFQLQNWEQCSAPHIRSLRPRHRSPRRPTLLCSIRTSEQLWGLSCPLSPWNSEAEEKGFQGGRGVCGEKGHLPGGLGLCGSGVTTSRRTNNAERPRRVVAAPVTELCQLSSGQRRRLSCPVESFL